MLVRPCAVGLYPPNLLLICSGTVVSSLPYYGDGNKKHNLRAIFEDRLKEVRDDQRNKIESTDALVEFILKRCVTFLRRKGPAGLTLEETFKSSIDYLVIFHR